MNETSADSWQVANQRHVAAGLERVAAYLRAFCDRLEADAPKTSSRAGLYPVGVVQPEADETEETPESAAESAEGLPALEIIGRTFDLSSFERNLLLLAAGVELDAEIAALCARAQGSTSSTQPTFGLALAIFEDSHWSALSPSAPLRRWQLLELADGPGLTSSPLIVDERILHLLAGVECLEHRLEGILQPMVESGELVPSHRQLAEQIAATWAETAGSADFPVIQLCGEEVAGKRVVAAAACSFLGLELYRMPADALPGGAAELAELIRLWEREAILGPRALLLDCEEVEERDPAAGAVSRVVEGVLSPLVLSTRKRRRPGQRPSLSFDVDKPTATEQLELWRATLKPWISAGDETAKEDLDGTVEDLVGQFDLSAPMIRAAAGAALGASSAVGAGQIDGKALWQSCRAQARPLLEGLARRITSAAGWDELVLPRAQRRALREIAVHVRQRAQVFDRWGFAAKSSRGLGTAALFAGTSGTGKTMAAEVLGVELKLDVYRIDLSSVVSKYIGETEKNLSRVFGAAESGGAILLFDEADALFGKRTEVKDSHDRHANIEVSYLLQRMETYRGLAILTTNLKSAVDDAFLRRFRFIVDFPFPNQDQRAEIWRRIFPTATPTEDLRVEQLARLNVAGGNIRNIAVHAAFLAADAGEPVRMGHLLHAARQEFAKIGRALPDSEIRDWL